MLPSLVSDQVRRGVEGYLRATFEASGATFSGALDRFLTADATLFKGPYLSLRLPFRPGSHPDISPFKNLSMSFDPYLHQEKAFDRLTGDDPKSTLVATGTGSGKTECFLYPLLEHCARERAAGKAGIKAIVIYPMNALATDQAKRFADVVYQDAQLNGHITVGEYVGGQSSEAGGRGASVMSKHMVITDKEMIRRSPPDILLTNYKMLDYLLTRPQDRELWADNAPDTLRFIVVDELHTFDGAQGTDLACLLRRLKARLGTPDNHLCAVGTSATLGGDGSGKVLQDYATTLFGEEFDENSVITEDVLSPAQFLKGSTLKFGKIPSANEVGSVDPRSHETAESFLNAAHQLWFDNPVEEWNEDEFSSLGERLRQHGFFRSLLMLAGGKELTLGELSDELGRVAPEFHEADEVCRKMALDSFLALISAARAPKGAYPRHFLQVRNQVWLRELRRIVCSVEKDATLGFSDDLTTEEAKRHLPVVHCRECGTAGWAGTIRKQDTSINPEPQTFYQGFFANRTSPDVCYAFPLDEVTVVGQEVFPRKLCGWCLTISDGIEVDSCECCGKSDRMIPVYFKNERNRNNAGVVTGSTDCPSCGSSGDLSIIGSQAASLISAGISQLYSTPYNDDNKLLAFSDSVQDASHRAGFFSARTYTFSFRSALQSFVEKHGGDGLSLSELPEKFHEYWLNELGGEEKLVGLFLPPDLDWLDEYEKMVDEGALPKDSRLSAILKSRLRWELVSEYSYRSQIGRTLERACCSAAFFETKQFGETVPKVREILENQVGNLRGNISDEEIQRFLIGMLERMRTQGGVYLDELSLYGGSQGDIYLWNNKILREGIKYLPKLGWARSPRFLSLNTNSGRRAHVDGLVGSISNWYNDWLRKNFEHLEPKIADMDSLIWPELLQVLFSEKIVLEYRGKENHPSSYGLNPDFLTVTAGVSRYACKTCKSSAYGPSDSPQDREGMKCLRSGCRGTYELSEKGDDYYSHLFRSGRLERVFAHEHTGLLERNKREVLEQRFIKGGGVAAPNLLSCTPTLEMGINVGDLSSVVLCSVPPTQSNYLQRIGRAGRKNGNAFNMVVAQGQPHDLYFYQDPKAMMAGDVTPPGTYLRAPAVLERQFAGMCFDQWVKNPQAAVPRRLSEVLDRWAEGAGQAKGKFPFDLLAFVEDEGERLADEFVAMFKGILDSESVEYVHKYAGLRGDKPLVERLQEKFVDEDKERNALKRRVQRITRKLREFQDNPAARDQNYDETLKEMRNEKRALTRILKDINEKDVYQFFTDKGILPNYAFPEAGVVLKSIILKRREKDGAYNWETDSYEYERSAAAALSEFAPANHFYAGGRKVRIERVDMDLSKVEQWRFCPECPHSELVVTSDESTNCPSCGTKGWSDSGQVKEMVRLRQVFATTSDSASRSRDDKDEREVEFFKRNMLVGVEEKDITTAYKLADDELPFGFEFLSRASFREINFGKTQQTGDEVVVAGHTVPKEGFKLCKSCGQVDLYGAENFKHAIDCRHRNSDLSANPLDALYLYREFHSEAIRILLPVSSFGVEQRIESFMAALYLGLKTYFDGDVDHLRISHTEEPDADSSLRKRYLVLYDTVPGGTGYLKELMRGPDKIPELFRGALKVLQDCPCGAEHEKDGCYRCLYAYRVSRDMNALSRSTAIELLSQIVEKKDSFEKTTSLKTVSLSSLFDSELEERFIDNLKKPRIGQTPPELSSKTVNGRPGYSFKVGERQWDIEIHANVGEREGVVVPSEVDFLFKPVGGNSEGVLPLAVYTDGYAYHANIDSGKYRVGKDFAQRMALVKSGKYRVWSLTYEDVVHKTGEDPKYRLSPYGKVTRTRATIYDQFDASKKVKKLSKVHLEGAFDSLFRYLNDPDLVAWQSTAFIEALLLSGTPMKVDKQTFRLWDSRLKGEEESELGVEIVESESPAYAMGKKLLQYTSGAAGLATLSAVELQSINSAVAEKMNLICRLADEGEKISNKEEFQPMWNAALTCYNLMQFLPRALLLNTRGLADGSFPDELLEDEQFEETIVSSEWESVHSLTLPEFRSLAKSLEEAGKEMPEVGYEFTSSNGEVVGTAEFAWPIKKIAVCTAEEKEQGGFPDGWEIFGLEDVNELLQKL